MVPAKQATDVAAVLTPPVALAIARHAYVPALDGLRAVCILAVLAMHIEHSMHLLPPGAGQKFIMVGWCGVDVFFVLSGFLITWIIAEEHQRTDTINLSRFYLRRALRLMPAYLSAIVLTLAGTWFMNRGHFIDMARALPFFLTYTLNIAFAAGYPVVPLGIAWSLCLEEQFYFLWPWLLRWVGIRRALPLVSGLVAAIAIYRSALYVRLNGFAAASVSDASAHRVFNGTDTRFDIIFVGCALALLMRHTGLTRKWERLRNFAGFSTIAAGTVLAVLTWLAWGAEPTWASVRSATLGYTLLALSVAALIAAVYLQPESWVARVLAVAPMAYVGRISYGIYLFHIMAIGVVSRLAMGGSQAVLSSGRAAIVFFGSAAAAIGIAALHYHVVERPILKRRPMSVSSI